MAIERKELVQGHNPGLFGFDYNSPMTLGNGEFAFNADVTGLQTFYDLYEPSIVYPVPMGLAYYPCIRRKIQLFPR